MIYLILFFLACSESSSFAICKDTIHRVGPLSSYKTVCHPESTMEVRPENNIILCKCKGREGKD